MEKFIFIYLIFSPLFQPEPFFLSFALYDAKEGKKISEDFYIDPNDLEIKRMIPEEILCASDKLNTVDGKNSAPYLFNLAEEWLLKKDRLVSIVLTCTCWNGNISQILVSLFIINIWHAWYKILMDRALDCIKSGVRRNDAYFYQIL